MMAVTIKPVLRSNEHVAVGEQLFHRCAAPNRSRTLKAALEFSMNSEAVKYGVDDCSYKAAGELPGLIRLVDAFYDYMESLPEARNILRMHPADLTLSRKKLAFFLSGWLGGPKLYSENFGAINIPLAHKHLPVGLEERDAWIICMQKAVAQQPYEESFKSYLIEQLRVPAERIRIACST